MGKYENLIDEWDEMYNNKAFYSDGSQTLDLDSFRELVAETYNCLAIIKENIEKNDFSNINPEDIRDHIYLISTIARYSTGHGVDSTWDIKDEDAFNDYQASQLVAYCLVEFGANRTFFGSKLKQPNDGILYYYNDEFQNAVIKWAKDNSDTIEITNENLYSYNIKDGDLSSFKEAIENGADIYIIN